MATVTSSASLLWIEGNTNDTVHVVPDGVTCTYNVDNPTFWPPLSVLSGLASGFCERKATLNPVFVAGTTWTANTSAGIVAACMNGLALGSTGNALFNAANNAVFRPVGKATAQNYMTAMDAAITTLVTGTTRYVTETGADYKLDNNAFSGLAASATQRAAARGSSLVATPVSNGGATYKSVFYPGYPVEWAKQRKWMLDELRYTPGEPTYVGNNLENTTIRYDANTRTIYATAVKSVESCRAAYMAVLGTTATSLPDKEFYCFISGNTDTNSFIQDWDQQGRTLIFVSNFDSGTSKWYSNQGSYYWAKNGTKTIIVNGVATTEQEENAVYITGTTYTENKEYTIKAYFGQGCLFKSGPDFSYWNKLVTVTGSIQAQGTATDVSSPYTEAGSYVVNNIYCYEVLAGGTLSIASNKQPYSVLVHPGGLVKFANGGRAETCVVLKGGTVSGIPNVVQGLCMDPFYPLREITTYGANTTPDIGYHYATFRTPLVNTSFYVVNTTGVTYSTTAHGRAVYVSQGGVLTINSNTNEKLNTVTIGDGGKVVVSGLGATDDRRAYLEAVTCNVLSGGSLVLSANYKLSFSDIIAYPGAYVKIFEDHGASHTEGSTILQVGQGATLNLSRGLNATDTLDAITTFYINSGGFTNATDTTGAYTRPIVQINGATTTSRVVKKAAMACFNGNGLVLNGTDASVHEGENTATLVIKNSTIGNTTVQGIAHVDDSKLPISTDNCAPYEGCFTGEEATKAIYRCSIVYFKITPGNGTGTKNHYDEFHVRQWAEDLSATQ